MKSIYFKNFLATAIMVLVSFLMIGVAFVFIGQGYIIKSHRDNMESNARVISRLTTSLVYEEGLTDLRLRILLNGTSLISGNHIFITNDEGLILSCSDELGRCQHLGRSVDASYINTLEQQGSLDIVTDLGGLFSSQRYVFAMAMTVADSGAPVGYIFVSTDRSTIMGAWSAFIWVFFAVTLAVLFLALVLSLVVSKKMAEPLDEMTAAARRFAHGDFSVRVREDKGTDELAALTSSFNNMADSLERSEQQRNEFIANVSHELKTPMTTIAGFADGILDGTIPKEQEDKYLATIADETRRLSRLVRHMLSLSRMESQGSDLTKRRDFDLNELIIRTLLSFDGRTEEKGLDMQLQLPEDHMSVTADPDSITQVLYNLLDNAVKFASEGTAVTISLWKQGGKAYVSVKTGARPSRRTTCPSSSTASTSPTAPAALTATGWASASTSSRASSTRTMRTSPSRAGTGSRTSSSPSPSRGSQSRRPSRAKSPNSARSPSRAKRPGRSRPPVSRRRRSEFTECFKLIHTQHKIRAYF